MHKLFSERGGAVGRMLCGILGFFSIVLALSAGIVGLVMAFDPVSGDVYDAVLCIVLFVMLGSQGVLMFVLPARIARLRKELQTRDGQQVAQPGAPVPGAPVPPTTVAPNPAPAASSPNAAPQPAPTSTPAKDGEPSHEETSRMLLRSENIFATAKDIARTQRENPASARQLTHLSGMLAALNIDAWESAPTCIVTKLGRTGSYWLRFAPNELSDADYDLFIATEAALNLDLALPELAEASYDDPATTQKTLVYLRRIVDQESVPYDFAASLGCAYPNVAPQETPGEWYTRATIVNDAECVRLPFRLLYGLHANADAGIAVLRLEIPRPRCFAVISPNSEVQTACARSYALRLCWLLANHAFGTLSQLERLEVLCHERGHATTLLGISFTRDFVQQLKPLVAGQEIEGNGFPQDEKIVARFGADGWFEPVEPRFAFANEVVVPKNWYVYPELDDRPLSAPARTTCGAAYVRDLSINENAPRVNAMDGLADRWRELPHHSCESIVATLVDLRDATDDVTIAEACERTAKALLDGTVDPTDEKSLGRIFVSDGALQDAAQKAGDLLGDDHPDPEAAIPVLREVLDPILSFGFYADDESCVYRYFGSVAERLVFNTRIDDHARTVRLVPDSYYNALSYLSSALTALGQHAEAVEIAEEMMRIAPASMDAVMRKVRALENEARIFEAAELIKEHMTLAATPRDAALAHYRLAYMQWKLGREDLAAACYQRALTWDTPLSEMARSELNDLLESYEELERSTPQEAVKILEAEGIPLGYTAADQSLMLTSATLLMDEHAFLVAQPLLSVVCSAEGDDVLVSLRRSMDP